MTRVLKRLTLLAKEETLIKIITLLFPEKIPPIRFNPPNNDTCTEAECAPQDEGKFRHFHYTFSSSTNQNLQIYFYRQQKVVLGLGFCHFARRYFDNNFYFLFLAVLRGFTSRGLLTAYASVTRSNPCRVSSFGNSRIEAVRGLPETYRSLTTSFIAIQNQGIHHILLTLLSGSVKLYF